MTAYDVLRSVLSEWPRLQRSVVFLVVTLGLAMLFAIGLTAVAYYQSGVIAGYAFGQNVHLPQNAIIMMEERSTPHCRVGFSTRGLPGACRLAQEREATSTR